MTSSLLVAFGLMLIIEGVLPFVAPVAWRDTFRRLVDLSNGQIRFVGFCSMLVGLIVITVF